MGHWSFREKDFETARAKDWGGTCQGGFARQLQQHGHMGGQGWQ